MADITNSSSPSCLALSENEFGPSVDSCGYQFDFTLLFEQSILSIAPSVVFLICVVIRLVQLIRQNRKIQASPLRNFKLITAALLCFQQVAQLVLWSIGYGPTVETAVPSSTVSLLGSLALVVLSPLEHGRSVRSSDLLNAFLFLSVILDIAQVRTLWLLRTYTALAVVATIGIAVKTILWLLEMQSKTRHVIDRERLTDPETLSGVFSRRLFWWLNPLFINGQNATLDQNKLPNIDPSLASEKLGGKLVKYWFKASHTDRYALLKSVFWVHKSQFIRTIIPRICLIGFKFAQPFLVNSIVRIVGSPRTPSNVNDGYGLIGATGLVYIGIAICTGYYQHSNYRLITMVRGSLIPLIYYKTLRVPLSLASERGPVTLMSTDIDSIAGSLQWLHEVWASPIEIALAIWLLDQQIGVACIVTVVIVLACSFVTTRLAKLTGPKQSDWNHAVQERVSVTSAALTSIKSIKISGLSDVLFSQIQSLRAHELDLSKKFRILVVWINMVASFPLVAPVITFAIYFALKRGQDISMDRTFTAMTLIVLLSASLNSFIGALPSLTGSLGCFSRIQAFLVAPERVHTGNAVDTDSETRSDIEMASINVTERAAMTGIETEGCSSHDSAIDLHGASFVKLKESHVLTDITISITRGSLTIVTGPVGCGKSTLLQALSGELICNSGAIRSDVMRSGYCAQSPWLQNASIRDNIKGESEWSQAWFTKVLSACELLPDINGLEQGDASLIGSSGITLSGGQQKRIALARAIYARPDILLLDDVFSSLDAKTSQLVFSNLFGPRGLIQSLKITTVLVTHSLQLLPFADKVIIMSSDGRIASQGLAKELTPAQLQYIEHHNRQQITSELESTEEIDNERKNAKVTGSSSIVDDNSRRMGDIKLYHHYLQSVGWTSWLIFIGLSVIYVFLCNFPQVWLRLLVDVEISGDSDRIVLYFCIYGLLAILGILSVGLCIGYMFISMVPKSAKNLHKALLKTVMSAPLSFFASTDHGVTLNRFSQDMQLVDMVLPTAVFRLVVASLNCVAAVILISIGAAYVAIVVVFICACLYLLQKYYLRTSRQLRYLDLEAKSPLYTHFSETLDGLATIRAFGWQDSFYIRLWHHLDYSQKPYYLLYCIQRWLNIVLSLFVAAVAILLVAFALELNISSSGSVAVALVTLLGLNEQLTLVIMSWTSLETSLGAIARLKEFSSTTPQETQKDCTHFDSAWPESGSLELRGVSACYSPQLRPCLQNVSITVPHGCKLGIFGRTGSGKSSFVLSILRLLETTSGSILIDGKDTVNVPLQTLRSRITAISQDAFLLKGSVRYNLDPFHESIDNYLAEALEKVGLWKVVERHSGLDSDVETLNFSQGQTQLFALARAMVRKSKLIIMDESLSNVDEETEKSLDHLFAREWIDCTVIAVVHRTESLNLYDKVAVMDDGSLVWVGSPEEARKSEVPAVRSLFSSQHDS